MRCPAIVPEVFTYSAAISVCDEPAAPAGITSRSSVAAPWHRAGGVHLQGCYQRARRASSASRRNISFERCGAMPSRRMCPPTAVDPCLQAYRLFRARRGHAIVSVVFHLQCGHQRVRRASNTCGAGARTRRPRRGYYTAGVPGHATPPRYGPAVPVYAAAACGAHVQGLRRLVFRHFPRRGSRVRVARSGIAKAVARSTWPRAGDTFKVAKACHPFNVATAGLRHVQALRLLVRRHCIGGRAVGAWQAHLLRLDLNAMRVSFMRVPPFIRVIIV